MVKSKNPNANQLPTDVVFEKQLGQLTTFVRVMRQAGLPIEEALQMPIDDPEMRKRLVRFWSSGGYEAITTQKLAREIMGKNFFGVEEAVKHFGVNPSKSQLAALAEIPFSEATLRECKNTHVLVAVFPISILSIRSRVSSVKLPNGQPLLADQSWYNKEPFAQTGETRWKLVKITPVDNSTNKTYQEQQALLTNNEETPTAQAMVYTIIGHYLATGERLMEHIYVRCSDMDSDGFHVLVGSFDSSGLFVYSYWDGYRDGILGLASAWKSPPLSVFECPAKRGILLTVLLRILSSRRAFGRSHPPILPKPRISCCLLS